MADPWVPLLIAGTVLLVGFAASLAFQRFRVPDFILLLLLGAALGQIPVAPFGPGLLTSLAPLLTVFTQLAIAFILFEGGLSLRLREMGRSLGGIVAHSCVAMALTAVLLWFVSVRYLGLSNVTALVLAIAFAGPSASVALSFAPRMHLDPRAEGTIVLEGVLTNVIAVIGVLFVLQWYGASGGLPLVPYAIAAAESVLAAALVGLGWSRLVARLEHQRFLYIASLGMALVVYAAAQGFLLQNGAEAVFVFGIALAHGRASRAGEAAPRPRTAEDVLRELAEFVETTDGVRREHGPEAPSPGLNLRNFQAEITFAIRTFLFVYLGLLFTQGWGGLVSVEIAAVLVAAFVVGRAPSSFVLARRLRLPKRDGRAVFASMARGLTDVVLLLLGVQSGLLPAADVSLLLGALPAALLLAAVVCAALIVWAGRTDGAAAPETEPSVPANGR